MKVLNNSFVCDACFAVGRLLVRKISSRMLSKNVQLFTCFVTTVLKAEASNYFFFYCLKISSVLVFFSVSKTVQKLGFEQRTMSVDSLIGIAEIVSGVGSNCCRWITIVDYIILCKIIYY